LVRLEVISGNFSKSCF